MFEGKPLVKRTAVVLWRGFERVCRLVDAAVCAAALRLQQGVGEEPHFLLGIFERAPELRDRARFGPFAQRRQRRETGLLPVGRLRVGRRRELGGTRDSRDGGADALELGSCGARRQKSDRDQSQSAEDRHEERAGEQERKARSRRSLEKAAVQEAGSAAARRRV